MSVPAKGMRAFWDERDRQAFEMRQQGLKWREIGKLTGRTPQGANRGAQRWAEKQQEAQQHGSN